MNSKKTSVLRERTLAKGGILADFLNVATGLAKQKRLLDLLERYRKLQQLLPTVRSFLRIKGGPLGGALVYDLRANKEALSLIKQINRLLARYQFRRAVSQAFFRENQTPTIETGTYSYRSVPISRGERRNLEMGRGSGTVEEHGAVEEVLDLAEAGELDRLRQCGFCERWFMASRPDQLYCTAKCSGKRHRQERKESGKAAEYQRKYRRMDKLKQRIEELQAKLRLSRNEKTELSQKQHELSQLKSRKER